ncbi:MAG TPA: hypothetical protein VKZ87_14675 [Ferrovibrio sp.]|nr:hypothetical protein [Ferrovibrio sp.]HLT78626.1 hypothetical protein [Ferrovibrio sp.]
MLRLMLALVAFAVVSPTLTACTGQHPPRVPIPTEPGKTKTCPGGGTNC